MNEIPVLDEFEQAIARTLDIKADQVVVDTDDTFEPDVAAPIVVLRRSSEPVAPHARRGRRILAVAAAVAALVGAAAVVGIPASDDTDDTDVATAPDEVTWSLASGDGVAALVPAGLPDGWTMDAVLTNPGVVESEATWQLFAVDGPSPLQQAVLVGSTLVEGDVSLDGAPTHTVHGKPAAMGPSRFPSVPDGALGLRWKDGDVYHDVVAVGLAEDELLAFVEALEPRAEVEAGFDAPVDAALPELDTATVDPTPQTQSSAFYRGPGGVGSLSIYARTASIFGGGLLYRMVGEPHAGRYIIRGEEGDRRFIFGSRSDGWDVNMQFRGEVPSPEWLEGILDSLQPIDYQQVVDLGVAQPVTFTATVDDWTVEVHSTKHASMAVCLTSSAGETACGLAQGGSSPLTVGSVLVGDKWILVVVSDGTELTIIETTPSSMDNPAVDFETEALRGERVKTDGKLVELVVMPEDAGAVHVYHAGGDGYGFELRPAG